MSIEVSVLCITYNHEKYIRQALDSFLMQKTDFKYEIIVHDDASTDGTRDILKEYKNKYPDIITVIQQIENQYSRGIRFYDEYMLPLAKGKYIANCEGDDYWTDPLKLQKQFIYMESHLDIDMCGHTSAVFDDKAKNIIGYIKEADDDCVFKTSDILMAKVHPATSSMFYRKSLIDNIPRFRELSAMDIFFWMHGSLRGGIGYLKECMSAYRVNVDGSWTTNIGHDKEKMIANIQQIINIMYVVQEDTKYQYKDCIDAFILQCEASIIKEQRNYKELFTNKKYKKYMDTLPKGKVIELWIKAYFGWWFDKVRNK